MIRETISHYKILKELGQGGMAEVFEAINMNTRKRIALKMLLPHLASDTVIRKRFLREAQVGVRLDHPCIIKVYEVGEENEQPFMAMEFVKGKTLEEIMQSEILDVERAIYIAQQVADALVAAHTKKIVHRDIKPKNIMVIEDKVKVMDFGLAKILETSSLTDKHEILGTLHYMSPQQAIGDELDERSDIFSFGVVLYQMLTSTLPFAGEHPGTVIHAILYADPLRMSEMGIQVPVEVERVVFKAIKKKPQERYQTASELRSDLEVLQESLKGKKIQLIATEEVFEESPRGIYAEFVGREREMKILEGHLEKVMDGESTTVLLSGEVGIGKSRLAWELGRIAKKKHARYITERCFLGEKSFPYKPILEILRSYFNLKGIKDAKVLQNFIENKAIHLIERLEVIQALLQMKGGEEISFISKEQLWDTTTELLKVISQDRALVIHLDDLHLADEPTLNLLTYLQRNTQQYRILIIGSYRPEELAEGEHPLQSMMEVMGKEGFYTDIKLSRLGRDGTKNIIDSVFLNSIFPEKFADMVYKETEGNPLFVLEVLKLLRDKGVIHKDNGGWQIDQLGDIEIPKKITDVIISRLKNINKVERELMEIASVEGLSFQSDTLTYCSGVPRITVLRRLQSLESMNNLIHAREKEYSFDHGKIRDVLYESLIPELKKEYHGLIGEHYIKNYGKRDDYAGKLAYHLFQAGLEKESLPYFLKAGEYARKLFAHNDAIGYLSKSVELVEKFLTQEPTADLIRMKLKILKAKAEVSMILDDYDGALTDYKEIVESAKQISDQQELAYGMLGMGQSIIKKGNHDKGLDYYNQALELHKKSGNRHGEGMVLSIIAVAHWERGNIETALRFCRRALNIGNRLEDASLKATCFTWFGGIYHILGEYEKSIHYCEDAYKIVMHLKNMSAAAECLHAISVNNFYLGNYRRTLDYADKAVAMCTKIGHKFYEAWGYLDKGLSYVDLGEYAKALDFMQKSLTIFVDIGSLWGQGRIFMVLFHVYKETGDYEEALRVCEKGLEISKQIGDKVTELGCYSRIGYAHFGLGNYEEAFNNYENAIIIAERFGPAELQLNLRDYLTRLWLTLSDLGKAETSLTEATQIVEKYKTRPSRINHLIDTGLVELAKGSFEKAVTKARQALKIANDIKQVSGMNESLILMANIEFCRGNMSQAEKYAKEALTLAKEKGRKRNMIEMHLLMSNISTTKKDLEKAEYHAIDAQKIAEDTKMKELLWQAHFLLGKIYSLRSNYCLTRKEFKKAQRTVDKISSKLNKELKKTYLRRREIKELGKCVRGTKGKSNSGRKR